MLRYLLERCKNLLSISENNVSLCVCCLKTIWVGMWMLLKATNIVVPMPLVPKEPVLICYSPQSVRAAKRACIYKHCCTNAEQELLIFKKAFRNLQSNMHMSRYSILVAWFCIKCDTYTHTYTQVLDLVKSKADCIKCDGESPFYKPMVLNRSYSNACLNRSYSNACFKSLI